MIDRTHRTAHQCPNCRRWTCNKQSMIESHLDHPEDLAFRAARIACRRPSTEILAGQRWEHRRGGEGLEIERGPKPDETGTSMVLVLASLRRRRRLVSEHCLRRNYRLVSSR